MSSETKPDSPQQSFEQLAGQSSPGFLPEFWDFLIHNKKWWLTPIVVIMLLFGGADVPLRNRRGTVYLHVVLGWPEWILH